MTKNEFKKLAKQHGVTDVRYSGEKKIMFVHGDVDGKLLYALSEYSQVQTPWDIMFQ